MNREKILNWVKANKKGVGIIGGALAGIILIGGGYGIYRYINRPLQVVENKKSDTLLKKEETTDGTSDKTSSNTAENPQENNNEKTDEKSNNGNGVASAGNTNPSKGNSQSSSSTGGNGSNNQTSRPSNNSSSSSNNGQSKPNTSSSSKPSGNGNTSKPSKPNTTNKPSTNKPNTNNKPSKPVEKSSKPQRTWQYMSSLSQQTFNALNNYRTSHGVKALKYSSSCASGAKSRAEYNAKNKVVGHDTFQIALGSTSGTANSFINQWTSSSNHKRNILDDKMVDGAVAVYKDSDGYYYVVAQFGDDW